MNIKKVFIIFLFFVIALAGWGFLVEPNFVTTRNIAINDENAPDFLKNLKFLQISDLHIEKFGYREKQVLTIIKKQSPDFLFITGDIVNWDTKDFSGVEKFFDELSKINTGRVFAVFGNHDHRNNNFKELKDILSEEKITVLNNESEKIDLSEGSFYLVGVDDPHLGYDNIDKALAKTDGFYKILLAHSPEIFRKVAGKVNLVLVGHTHGCQVDLPGLCDLIMPLDYDKQYKKGLFEENSTYLYVSNGLGETFIPFRLNAFPEVVAIKIN